MTKAKPVCAVLGVGPGNGAAFARRFAAGGYRVALLSRDRAKLDALAQEIDDAAAFPCDAADPDAVGQALGAAADALGPVDTLIYNAGQGVWGDALSIKVEDFERSWRVNALGAFAAAQAVLPAMRQAGTGAVFFVGATASLRGGAKTAAFASAKGAQRLLAQSLARAYGPDGVHVALVIIDAVVAGPRARAQMPDKPEDFFAKPSAIAEAAWTLRMQDRSAWTFELDLRPFCERW